MKSYARHLMGFSLWAISNATLAQITFNTHPIKPLSWEEAGEYRGFCVEVVKAMMTDMGVEANFRTRPFARGLDEIQNDNDLAHFPVARRPEREGTVKWVGPLGVEGIYLYKQRNSQKPTKNQLNKNINTINGLANLDLICVGRGDANHKALEMQGLSNLYPVRHPRQCLLMLEAGRVDATPAGELVMPEMAKDANLSMYEFEKTEVKLYESTFFLAFSKNVPDAVVARWQATLDQLKADGTHQKILDKYISD